MGFRPTADELAVLIEEIDEDGSGAIEFGEFAQLCAKFLVEVSTRKHQKHLWKFLPNFCYEYDYLIVKIVLEVKWLKMPCSDFHCWSISIFAKQFIF